MKKTPLSRGIAAALGTAAVAAAFAGPAAALDETKPDPTCQGASFEDPAGDAGAALVGPESLPVGENLDITGGFFKYDGEAVTANIKVKDLDQSVPPFATGIGWYMHYSAGNAVKYVKAEVDLLGGLTYAYGTLDLGYTDEGSTKGKLFEGPDGIVQIQLPGGAGLDGSALKSPYASAKATFSIPGVGGLLANADDGPDSQRGKDFVVSPCGGGPGADALGVSLAGSAPKASKVRKKLVLSLAAAAPVTSLAGKLTKGRTTYAAGKLAKLDGKGRLSLKVTRKVRKGSYVLKLTGTVDGAKQSGSVKVKLG